MRNQLILTMIGKPHPIAKWFVLCAAFAANTFCKQTNAGEQRITVRGSAFASIDSALALAGATQPDHYVVPDGGQTPKEVIISKCGDGNSEEVVDALAGVLSFLNGSDRFPNKKFAARSLILVPFCAPVYKDRKVKARDGETLASIVASSHPKVGLETAGCQTYEGQELCPAALAAATTAEQAPDPIYKSALKSNPTLAERACGDAQSPNQNCDVKLKDGEVAIVPYTAPWVTGKLTSASPLEMSFLEISGEIQPKFRQRAGPDTESASGPEGIIRAIGPSGPASQVSFIKPLSLSEVAAENDCAGDRDATTYPVDVARVRERLKRGEEALRAKGRSPRTGRIAIIDTGVSRTVFLKEKMPTSIFFRNSVEADGEDNVDDYPKNGIYDDIYGANPDNTGEVIELLGHDTTDERNHGTHVTTMAFGGVSFLESIVAPGAGTSPIQVAMLRATWQPVPGNPQIDPGFIARAVQWSNDQRIDIVNVSLSHDLANAQTTYDSILRGGNGPRLLIAAGGNDGIDLDLGPGVFPASMGGDGIPLISVGAHDQKGAPLARSNYGAQRIDIFAPGCGFRSLSENAEKVLVSGTSFAAPLVSFTAALLKRLNLNGGLEIKNRILASSDYDLALEDKAKSAGRLNILKALSVFDDAIELREPIADWHDKGAVVVGRLQLESAKELARFCNDTHKRRAIGSADAVLRKVDIYEDKEGHLISSYTMEDTGTNSLLKRRACPLYPGEVKFIEAGTDEVRLIPIHKIKDVVLHLK